MSNWCDNVVTIEFPSPESKANFKAKLEDTSLKQDNTIRKAKHIFLLTRFGRCMSTQTTDPTNASHDSSSPFSHSYFESRENELPAFSHFKSLMKHNPVIDDQVSEAIDRIYNDMNAISHTYETFSEKEKERLARMFKARYSNKAPHTSEAVERWYDSLVRPMTRSSEAIMDFDQFVGWRLTNSLDGGNPFTYAVEEKEPEAPYGTRFNSEEPWEEIVKEENDCSVKFSLLTRSCSASPVFQAIFSEYLASGSIVTFDPDSEFASIEKFKNGQSISYSEDELIVGDIDAHLAGDDPELMKGPQYVVDVLYR